MFIIMVDAMWKIDYDQQVDLMLQNRFKDFDPIEDIEVLASQKNRCTIRTWKLTPTLFFMQRAGRRIWELVPDDEYISGVKFEHNILTFYKSRNENT